MEKKLETPTSLARKEVAREFMQLHDLMQEMLYALRTLVEAQEMPRHTGRAAADANIALSAAMKRARASIAKAVSFDLDGNAR